MADHYDSASGLTLTASRADLLKTLAQSRPRSYGAGDTFLTVPYRPILPRLDCHAWLSVRRPERRLRARSPWTGSSLTVTEPAGEGGLDAGGPTRGTSADHFPVHCLLPGTPLTFDPRAGPAHCPDWVPPVRFQEGRPSVARTRAGQVRSLTCLCTSVHHGPRPGSEQGGRPAWPALDCHP